MDLENQKRVKELAEQYGPENIVVLLGAAEGEASGLAAETVTNGDPTYAGPLTGVSLGLKVYHVCEPEVKAEFDEAVYEEQVSMMEMVLDVDSIIEEMKAGLKASDRYLAITDRHEAIRAAVALARPGDIILIAGKGHETYQDVGGKKHHFDDREEITQALIGH